MIGLSEQVSTGFLNGNGPLFAYENIVRPMLEYINNESPPLGQPAFDPESLFTLWYLNHGSNALYKTFVRSLFRCFKSTDSIQKRIQAATQLQHHWESSEGDVEPFDMYAMGVPVNRTIAFDLSQQFVQPLVRLMSFYIAVSGATKELQDVKKRETAACP